MSEKINNLRKKIIYRSHKRGFLESEIIFRNFINEILTKMTDNELECLNILLSYDDPQIIRWINKKETPPNELKPILKHILETLS